MLASEMIVLPERGAKRRIEATEPSGKRRSPSAHSAGSILMAKANDSTRSDYGDAVFECRQAIIEVAQVVPVIRIEDSDTLNHPAWDKNDIAIEQEDILYRFRRLDQLSMLVITAIDYLA